jgi:CBS domain-containing protein
VALSRAESLAMSETPVPQPVSGGAAPVSVYAADTVVTAAPEATLAAVASELIEDQIGLVVLGTVDHVRGVVSERDVARAVAEGRDLGTAAIDIASTKLVWCDSTATVREVAEQMMEQYVRHVLLEEGGKLVGIVSARDLLGAYAMSTD